MIYSTIDVFTPYDWYSSTILKNHLIRSGVFLFAPSQVVRDGKTYVYCMYTSKPSTSVVSCSIIYLIPCAYISYWKAFLKKKNRKQSCIKWFNKFPQHNLILCFSNLLFILCHLWGLTKFISKFLRRDPAQVQEHTIRNDLYLLSFFK